MYRGVADRRAQRAAVLVTDNFRHRASEPGTVRRAHRHSPADRIDCLPDPNAAHRPRLDGSDLARRRRQ